jgi:predicted Zn finger-like uncharacterized protein
MIVVCPSCQSRYRFDEGKLGDRRRAKTRCTKCGAAIEIENPLAGAATLPPGAEAAAPEPPRQQPDDLRTRETRAPEPGESGADTMAGVDARRVGMLQLPKDKRYSLAVIQGPATGQIFPVNKTRMVIGRSGADINLDDPEASRQHAALEIIGDIALLRDLESTNGTWIELERIEQQQLSNQQEFRIGSHVLMFIVTDVE